MRKYITIASFVALAACSQYEQPQSASSLAAAPAAATSESLVAAGDEWLQLYTAQDWGALRELYEDDAILMAHKSPKVVGKDAIVTFLRRLSDAGGSAQMRFEPEEAIVHGDLGIVTAKYWMNMTLPGGQKNNIAGRSLLIYKWRDGSWKLWRDMDNFSPGITADPLPDDG